MKIIPAIDLMGGKVVRLFKGKSEEKTVYSSDPLHIAKQWENAGADMIHIVDLDAAFGYGSNIDIIRNIAKSVFVPLEVAGGIRDKKTASDVAQFASKIVVGTIAFNDSGLLDQIAHDIGKEKLVIAVDHRDDKIVVKGWQQSTEAELLPTVKGFRDRGYSEFLMTDVNRDGTMEGPNLEKLKEVCQIKGVKIIASGGISSIQDVIKVKKANAYGVILGKSLYEKKISVEEAKEVV